MVLRPYSSSPFVLFIHFVTFTSVIDQYLFDDSYRVDTKHIFYPIIFLFHSFFNAVCIVAAIVVVVVVVFVVVVVIDVVFVVVTIKFVLVLLQN